ncbi:ABC transporter ATP-binding protein [Desulfomicrobium escambiense]|uniref:ABC transporter ATP-binding protein n=1 Tax=Desulfomicrobium escambiense TaxID=29503 RepID=UPI00041D3EC9|nr:ABC transporter ATP-binding protein [Desulfomicrobium escambiense]
MTKAIHAHGLKKSFGTVHAVSDISFTVEQGEVFGLLGPNGAGKTTTINMLTGLARPDAGSIVIQGMDCVARPRSAQHLIGVVPDESNLYPELTGFENLCFCAALYGLPKAERILRARTLLTSFGLEAAADRPFAGYSKGMKRKLTIAAGIIHNPDILFLDEPTTGVDVASARQLRQIVQGLKTRTTVFLTTHYIEGAERLCDRIAFLVAGRIVHTDTVENLLQPVQSRHIMIVSCCGMPGDILDRLQAEFLNLEFTRPEPALLRVESDAPVRVGPLVRFLEDNGGEVAEARRLRPSLEDVFVRVTGLEAASLRKEKEKKGGGQ